MLSLQDAAALNESHRMNSFKFAVEAFIHKGIHIVFAIIQNNRTEIKFWDNKESKDSRETLQGRLSGNTNHE